MPSFWLLVTSWITREFSLYYIAAKFFDDPFYRIRLLLGVDHKNRKIICGLVDTFGTYNFAKTIESKAKHGLNAAKDKEVS